MIKLHGSVIHPHDASPSPEGKIVLEIHFPYYTYFREGSIIERTLSETKHFRKVLTLPVDSYAKGIPVEDLLSLDFGALANFTSYIVQGLQASNTKSGRQEPFPIRVYVKDEFGQVLTDHTHEALFGVQLKNEPRTEQISVKEIYERISSKLFLLNADSFEVLLTTLQSRYSNFSSAQLSSFIYLVLSELAELESGYLKSREITETDMKRLEGQLAASDIDNPRQMISLVGAYIDPLGNFPVHLPEMSPLEVKGTFQIISDSEMPLEKSAFGFYEIEVAVTSDSSRQPVILSYDWSRNESTVSSNTLPVTLIEPGILMAGEWMSAVIISVKGYDGAILWKEAFDPFDSALQHVAIVINEYSPAALTLGGEGMNPMKKLRGKVVQYDDAYDLNDLTVVVQAKKEDEILWKPVSAGKTDRSGNFSLDYPYGNFSEAQALVSLMPDAPVDIEIVGEETTQETISDDFIYIIINGEGVESEPSSDDDCGCNSVRKAGRLPDHADLLTSDEYTQDIGGACTNLTTPNRTLREYSYNAIVRTSDPDVANYTLEKSESGGKTFYELRGGSAKLERKAVDLDNPIKWQDAPDASSNLSLYQAVTVATGHILHYKSIFKADGYSLGELIYSLPLAPGQKKQVVVFDSSHSLSGAETQSLSQGESLAAELISDRSITDQLGGNVNEALRGSSSATTSGISAGLGGGFSYGGFGASLGVAGGYANSNSSASQNSSRGISQFFDEKLRQAIIQNAESYRELNASVVTTVTEGQQYGVTTEVIANHNHCHSLTMMYFEVLRHYAIYQELAAVEECIFVPLLMTNFTRENIHKWKDILAKNLLPIHANTYLQPFSYLLGGRRHPLLKAFDANERINTSYSRVEFPANTYADEVIEELTGFIKFNIHIPRPKTRFDRILSFPVIKQTITTEGDIDVGGTIRENIKDSVIGAIVPCAAKGPSIKRNTVTTEVLTRGAIFDMFMDLDANYETVPPAQCIRVKFDAVDVFNTPIGIVFDGDATPTPMDFFGGMEKEKKLWSSYAAILGISLDELFAYFNGNVIADWDRIFNEHIAPQIVSKLINESTISIPPLGTFDLSEQLKYRGGKTTLTYNLRSSSSLSVTRRAVEEIRIDFRSPLAGEAHTIFFDYILLNVQSIRLNYATDFSSGILVNKTLNDDLRDDVLSIRTPLSAQEKRNPRKEDEYIVNELLEHLNSNLEHYNKVLWYNLDPDRRYMLLDGFHIEIFNRAGLSAGYRSLASVVKNELISVAGNSLVFPVADGYKVSKSFIVEETQGAAREISLLDYYKPAVAVPPYRISVPTKGVFMEAIQGACDACEKVKPNSSQDWDKFRTDEPTSIAQVVTPTPSVTNYQPNYKDFAQPLVNIQNAPPAPAPAQGLAALNELLGKSGIFNDITGLQGNQENVIRTYLSNQENAKAFAEMAKGLAMQQHNTANSGSIMDSLNAAHESGAISDEEYGDLVGEHLRQQIDGGEARRAEAERLDDDRPSLTDAAIEAASQGRTVRAERTDEDGTHESVSISGPTSDTGNGLAGPPFEVTPLRQVGDSCWATVATMLMNWKSGINNEVIDVLRQAGNHLTPPSPDRFVRIYQNTENNGLPITMVDEFLNALELAVEPPASYMPAQYRRWLETYGPLWINIDSDDSTHFSPHAKLLTDMTGDVEGSADEIMLTFIDPSAGRVVEQSFTDFIESYEQAVRDQDPDANLITQIIHHRESIRSEGEPVLGTGSSATTLNVKLRNVHIPSTSSGIGNAGEATLEIRPIDAEADATPTLVGQTAANGRLRLDVSGLPEGTYNLNVIPANTFDYSIDNIREDVDDDVDKIYESLLNSIVFTISVSERGRRTLSLSDETADRTARVDQTHQRNIVELSGQDLTIRLQPLWMRSPNIGTAVYGRSRTIRSFVIHHTGNSAANSSINTFVGGDVTSIHYLLDINGRLIKMVNEGSIANHAGNSYWNGIFRLNDSSLGIEICNGNGDSYSAEQIETVVSLLRNIVDDGTLDSSYIRNIIGHSDIATTEFSMHTEPLYDTASLSIESSRRIMDPGPVFDWKRLERENLTYTARRDSGTSDHYLTVFTEISGLSLREGDNDSGTRYGGRTRTLSAGTTNNIIQLLQNDLKAIGYLINTDGNFTNKTEEALRVFRMRAFSNTDTSLLPRDINPSSGSVAGRIDFETAKKIRDYSPLEDPGVI